jgi:hypothetical protein
MQVIILLTHTNDLLLRNSLILVFRDKSSFIMDLISYKINTTHLKTSTVSSFALCVATVQ